MVNLLGINLDFQSLCQMTGMFWPLVHISMTAMVLILDMFVYTLGMEAAMCKEGMI